MIARSSGCRDVAPRRKDAGPGTPADPRPSYRAEAERLAREAEDLYARKRYREAEGLVLLLLDLQEETLGKRHPEYATGLSMLGELRFLQGDRDGAEPLLRQTVAIRREALGARHPEYAVALCCLAGLLARTGGHDEAEALLREALTIRREVLGARHPDTLQARAELDRLLRRRGVATVAGAGRRHDERDRALAALDRVLASSPKDEGESRRMGSSRRAAGNRLFGSVIVGGPRALPTDRPR
jgi:tetratricopeptide (TPR) repeat protein